MNKRKYLTTLRNVTIAALCVAWLLPLWMSGTIALDALGWWEGYLMATEKMPIGDYPYFSAPPFVVASYFFSIAVLLLGIIIFCLVFVRLCRAEKDRLQKMRQTIA